MGLENTGTVNNESDAGAGRGRSINRGPGDNGPVNPSATKGAGRGYSPAKLGAQAITEYYRRNSTQLGITVTPDPVKRGLGGAFQSFSRDKDGNIYLQGGTINGKEVRTSDLMLYDMDKKSWEGSDGEHLMLKLDGDGLVKDGVLLPGFKATSVTVVVGPWLESTVPTLAAPSGICYTSLGTFTTSGFLRTGVPGHRIASWCIGWNHFKTYVESSGY